TTQVADTTHFLRDKSLIALPVVFSFPETGFGGGVIAVSTFSFGKDSVGAKPSQASFGVTYTQNKQILVFFPFNVFFGNNKWYLNGDVGWYRYNYFYYGIGENRIPQEIFDVTFPRIKLLGARQVGRNNYVGVRYQYESYDVTKTVESGELASGKIAGSDFSRTSSLGVSVLRDTRDDVFYPRKGVFGEAYILPTSKIFGADREFTRIYADIAHYKSLSDKFVLATNYVTSFIIGDEVPFSQLSFIGGAKQMRGLYEGYFRDKNAAIVQAEARYEVWRFIGLVGFGAVGWMGDENQLLRLGKPKFTYGGGLRIATKKHLNLRIDYGFSPYEKGNLYATLGEAF
ncbi:MAG: BamA/TamA family outer membrane protein, partial [Spirosomaceae bacterium]|nr:BamA/TamA family outer membrane protein [Spirosomataceae bacterium]